MQLPKLQKDGQSIKLTIGQLIVISCLSALFILYPDLTWLPFDLKGVDYAVKMERVAFLLTRYIFLVGLVYFLVYYNLYYLSTSSFKKRLTHNTLISIISFAAYGALSFLLFVRVKHYGSLVLFQFFVVSILSTLLGHIVTLYLHKRKQEVEIEALKMENLQSSYDALTNQINPHFFFNSLNGLSALIRRNENDITLKYLNELSDVFRYILQSNKKGLVTLGEELHFVESFKYMMEVRFADKLQYAIEVDNAWLDYKIPVLSILPLLENIVVHNIVDSEHKMTIHITVNEANKLVVSNPIYPKLIHSESNGTGLKNLDSRFQLLTGQSIKVQDNGKMFTVFLPLINCT